MVNRALLVALSPSVNQKKRGLESSHMLLAKIPSSSKPFRVRFFKERDEQNSQRTRDSGAVN